MASFAHKQDTKLQERLQRELKGLRQEGSNIRCADCSDTDTRFASVTLGIFLCNRCFGIHRALGAHLTRAKVLTLDAWSEAEVAHLAAVGNQRSNNCYLARLPPDVELPSPTTPDREVERFARRKYEERRWYDNITEQASAAAGSPKAAASAGYVCAQIATPSAAPKAESLTPMLDLLSLETGPSAMLPVASSSKESSKEPNWLADFDPFAT